MAAWVDRQRGHAPSRVAIAEEWIWTLSGGTPASRGSAVNIVETRLPGVLILQPKVFGDERGFFVETFRETWLADAGVNVGFVQDNQSRSARGVLRGLHYQRRNPQGK